LLGLGVSKDYQAGIYWLSQAAENGNRDATLKLANYYFEGEFVSRDLNKASSLYKKAADQGDADAQVKLCF
jgi:TPR repeat protein